MARPSTKEPIINTGIGESERREIAGALGKVLADTYTLYLKTHNFHWNVKGPLFQTLHTMFETQYIELATAVDVIAERIRALGFPSPGSYSEFSGLTCVKEASGEKKAEDMVRSLLEGHEAVVRTARSAVSAADRAPDQVTVDLLTERMQVHEKTAWMLRSTLE